MVKQLQVEQAKKFLSLHTTNELLSLPNIWNPIGAKILQAKGFPAVATASAAISASLGYEDGEKIKRSTLMDILTRIAGSVEIPVTADIESGYGNSISELKETIQQVIDAGAVGINIEDSFEEEGKLRAIHEQCERIDAVRETSNSQGLHLVINARIDCFLSDSFETKEEQVEEAVIRAKAFGDAGADCVYPIGPGDEETVITLRNRISSPINILAYPTAAPLSTLQNLGVNRVSFGPFIFRSCLKKFIDITDALHSLGTYDCYKDMLPRDETKKYLNSDSE